MHLLAMPGEVIVRVAQLLPCQQNNAQDNPFSAIGSANKDISSVAITHYSSGHTDGISFKDFAIFHLPSKKDK